MNWLRSLFNRLWFKRLILAIVLLVVLGWFIKPFGLFAPDASPMTLKEFWNQLDAHRVASATINSGSQNADITLVDGKKFNVIYPSGGDMALADQLRVANVHSIKVHKPSIWLTILSWGLIALMPFSVFLLLPLLMGLMTQSSSGNRRVDIPDTRLKDVGGMPEVVEELAFYVQSLKDREDFKANNVRPPKGVLLYGPPGTGKTLLARAVAGETGLPFYAVTGSEFIEIWAGAGARRVRSLFKKAKSDRGSISTLILGAAKERGVIVFVDEIDAVGGVRGSGGDGGSQEHRQTVTQLLAEMDGFDESSRVMVFATTNTPEHLDPALRRPGRFDRLISVPLPDINGREEILNLHLSPHKVAPNVKVRQLAASTPGFAGADLANLVNQAATTKLRRDPKGPAITMADFHEALTTIMVGAVRKSMKMLEQDRKITAAHETGHALTGLVLDELPDPTIVSILPRGQAGGVTLTTPGEEVLDPTRVLKAQLVQLLGGRAGERLFLNGDFTQGAASDLAKATELATSMVCTWGMSGSLASMPLDEVPDTRAAEQLQKVEALLAEAEERAVTLLKAHSTVFDSLRRELLEKEVIDEEGLQTYKKQLSLAPASTTA